MFPVITLDMSDHPQVGRVVYAVFEQCHIDLRAVMALTWIWASNSHSGIGSSTVGPTIRRWENGQTR